MKNHPKPTAHRIFVMRPSAQAAALALSVLAANAAWAQSGAGSTLQRVEVTGSSIKRLSDENALPVQTITREEIARSAVTTASELLTTISASAAGVTDGASFSDIPGQRGFNGANLRGIGASSTLVLLNGRRLANFASPGGNSGVDLNAIPAAAVERVEVLKDGASAIYGSDAIGGVINFITRADYAGGDIHLSTSATQHGGAGKNIFTLSGGAGNLAIDRYNIFAVVDIQDTKPLRSTQRDWMGSSFQPDINLDVSSSNTYPANVRRVRASGSGTGSRYNPSNPTCNLPATVYAPTSFVGSTACLYDYMQDTEVFPSSQRASLLSRAQYALNADNTLFAEVLHNKTTTNYRISPQTVNGNNVNYPAGGKYYPTGLIAGYTGDLSLGFRLTEAGPRTNDVASTADRLLIGSKGSVGVWDYDTALNYSTNRVIDSYVDGYVRTSIFVPAMRSGKINPFGRSDAEGTALLNSAKISDAARDSTGTATSLDFKASRELFSMAGGNAALALGADTRRETLRFTPSALLTAGEIYKEGTAAPIEGSRTVTGVFAELNLPLAKSLEAQLALRNDSYSDIGGSTNPKIGVRWTPSTAVVFRGSAGSGFRAPSLSDLYTPTTVGATSGIYEDPLGCPQTKGTADDVDYCGIQPDKLKGGNVNLKPEKSKQFSFGVVLEPVANFTTTIDYWNLEKTDAIIAPEGSYFADPAGNAAYIKRDASYLPGVPGPIMEIDSRLRNIGSLKTSGVDISADWRLPTTAMGKFGVSVNGTYIIDYSTNEGAGAKDVSAVDKFANDQVVQRWRHTLTLNYDTGPWGATLQQTFYKGYEDQNPNPDGSARYVENYTLWNLTGTYAPSKAWKIRAGVKNLLDTNPPRSNQIYSFLAGYDSNYTDPRGRSYFVNAGYSFK
jgi:iron complex outermembrane receptor protein